MLYLAMNYICINAGILFTYKVISIPICSIACESGPRSLPRCVFLLLISLQNHACVLPYILIKA